MNSSIVISDTFNSFIRDEQLCHEKLPLTGNCSDITAVRLNSRTFSKLYNMLITYLMMLLSRHYSPTILAHLVRTLLKPFQ